MKIAKHLIFIINQILRPGCYPDKLKIINCIRNVLNKELKIIDQYPFCLLFQIF